jgi:hypothetical protein
MNRIGIARDLISEAREAFKKEGGRDRAIEMFKKGINLLLE